MSTVGSRTSTRYSTHSSSTGTITSRRFSTVPYINSPVTPRFGDRQLAVPRDQQQGRPASSGTDDGSTEMITIALAKAQNAVLLDQRNNVTAALDGYSQCCAILAEVIAKETDSDDITRLRQIHDTYSVRMHVLSTQLEPNPLNREMPPLPTQADLQEFEDEDEEMLQSFRQTRIGREADPPFASSEYRFSEVQPVVVQTSRPTLHRASSSRDSTGTSRPPFSSRKYSHSRTSSYTRTNSQDGTLGSLEQIPITPSITSYRPTSKRDTMMVPEMIDEEMDDAAFLERITRGFTSDEEILEDDTARPSTASTASSQSQNGPKKPSETVVLEQPPQMVRQDTEDYILPSPRTNLVTPRQPSPVPNPRHDRARNTSSPLPSSSVPTPRPSSAKKNLSISGAQPMLKSLSANNAIPNPDEIIVPGNPDAAPAVPPKIKKRPHLIRVVSESTMRTNYGGSRLSQFETSPVSPPPTSSLLTPGTSTTSNFFADGVIAKNVITRDREGAAPPEDPPEDLYLRPYWLMRSLIWSMKNQKGAYINTKLFVPQGVWNLKNVKLKGMEEKINCFNTMAAAVKQVLETDHRNVPLLLQEVASLEGTMETVQMNLQRKIEGKANGSNGMNVDSRTMGRKMSQSTLLGGWGKRLRSKSTASSTASATTPPSGKEAGLDGAYPNALLALFECALVLEQKFENLEPEDMPIKTQLRLDGSRRRIAEFFANVVLRLILQDLGTLMNKYVKRVNEWIIS